jgi:TolA-binding protein
LILSVFAGGIWLYLKTPEIVYNKAMRLYDQNRYLDARRVFGEFYSRYPHFSLGDEARFFHAMSAYLAGHYETAAADYRDFTEIFFDSIYLPEALYHWGLSLNELGRPDEMREIFGRLSREFPNSSWADHARKLLSREEAAP